MTVASEWVDKNFSRAAAQYDELAVAQIGWMRHGLGWALDIFPAKAQLLDAGCGTGLFALESRTERHDWQITGFDLAAGMCSVAATRCNRVVQADAGALPFANNSFDGAFSSLCLQWMNDKPASLLEIARVLKPGASVVIVVLGGKNLQELHSICGGEIKLLPMEPVATYHCWLEEAGLKVVREEAPEEKKFYPSAFDLLQSMRAIGAGNAMSGQPKPPRVEITRLIAEYDRRYKTADGVVATWQPIYLQARKS